MVDDAAKTESEARTPVSAWLLTRHECSLFAHALGRGTTKSEARTPVSVCAFRQPLSPRSWQVLGEL